MLQYIKREAVVYVRKEWTVCLDHLLISDIKRFFATSSTILTIRDFGYLFTELEVVVSVVTKQDEVVW